MAIKGLREDENKLTRRSKNSGIAWHRRHISPAKWPTGKLMIHMEIFQQDTVDSRFSYRKSLRSRNTGRTASLATTTSWTAAAGKPTKKWAW